MPAERFPLARSSHYTIRYGHVYTYDPDLRWVLDYTSLTMHEFADGVRELSNQDLIELERAYPYDETQPRPKPLVAMMYLCSGCVLTIPTSDYTLQLRMDEGGMILESVRFPDHPPSPWAPSRTLLNHFFAFVEVYWNETRS